MDGDGAEKEWKLLAKGLSNVKKIIIFILLISAETFANLLKGRNLTKSREGRSEKIGIAQFSKRIPFQL